MYIYLRIKYQIHYWGFTILFFLPYGLIFIAGGPCGFDKKIKLIHLLIDLTEI
jgi:hypothetical protein